MEKKGLSTTESEVAGFEGSLAAAAPSPRGRPIEAPLGAQHNKGPAHLSERAGWTSGSASRTEITERERLPQPNFEGAHREPRSVRQLRQPAPRAWKGGRAGAALTPQASRAKRRVGVVYAFPWVVLYFDCHYS